MFVVSFIIACTVLLPQQSEAEGWSFGKIGMLGNGSHNAASRSAHSILSPVARENSQSIFGPIPKYIGKEGFGYIPTLSDILGE